MTHHLLDWINPISASLCAVCVLGCVTATAATGEITKAPFGKVRGKPVDIYTLKNANGIEARITNMAVTVVVVTALALLVSGWRLNAQYELHGAARLLATAQQQGSAVAHIGDYRGQYHFAGRLTKPLENVPPEQLTLWAAAHPDGLIVTYANVWQPELVPGALPLYEQSYRDTQLRIWPVVALKGG